jgi:transcriptional regulator
MDKHKEIIRLREGGEKQREISKIVRCSLRDVSKTLKAAGQLGIAYKDLADRAIAYGISVLTKP